MKTVEIKVLDLNRWCEGNHRSANSVNKGEYTVTIPEWRKTRRTGISEELLPSAGTVFSHIRSGGKIIADVNISAKSAKNLNIENICLV